MILCVLSQFLYTYIKKNDHLMFRNVQKKKKEKKR